MPKQLQSFGKFSAAIMLGTLIALAGCSGGGATTPAPPATPTPTPPPPQPVVGVTQTAIATFTAPWAMAFLPDGRMLVTDNGANSLTLVTQQGVKTDVSGLPNRYGVYDVALDPNYPRNRTIYLTYPEPAPPGTPRNGPFGANPDLLNGVLALAKATLVESAGKVELTNTTVLWRQSPQIVSNGEWGGRIAFAPDKQHIFVTVGDRSVYPPAKSLDNTLGKIIRLNLDGSVPADNPFVAVPGALPEIWTLGHRNPYGLAFAPDGQLWESEHGPKGGDEFNRITPGANYGWPDVSYGDGYDDSPIPKPTDGDGYAASAYWWTPSIAPAGMIFYSGAVFADWKGDAILAGLVAQALIRVRISGDTAKEVQRIAMGVRMREIEQGPDGSLWALTDSPSGKLVKLSPVF